MTAMLNCASALPRSASGSHSANASRYRPWSKAPRPPANDPAAEAAGAVAETAEAAAERIGADAPGVETDVGGRSWAEAAEATAATSQADMQGSRRTRAIGQRSSGKESNGLPSQARTRDSACGEARRESASPV